jgi:RNA polymerase sigma-70 factor (family 1)
LNEETLYEDRELLSRVAEGDQAAFHRLFTTYKDRLFTFAYGLTHSAVDAEEVVQDVFMKLWEGRGSLPSIEHPQKYIFTMTRNRTLDLLTKIGRNQKLMRQVWANLSQSDDGTAELLQAKESQKLIGEAVSRLTERKQVVYRLSKEEGLTLDEIALQLGISKQTVKNTLTEALKGIKEYLSGHSELLAILFWIHSYCSLL